jgi:hypothetical protein
MKAEAVVENGLRIAPVRVSAEPRSSIICAASVRQRSPTHVLRMQQPPSHHERVRQCPSHLQALIDPPSEAVPLVAKVQSPRGALADDLAVSATGLIAQHPGLLSRATGAAAPGASPGPAPSPFSSSRTEH